MYVHLDAECKLNDWKLIDLIFYVNDETHDTNITISLK